MGEEQERKGERSSRIEKAVDSVKTEKKAGRPKELDLKQRTSLFLFARTVNKSNRDIENLLLLLKPLFGFEVGYKYVERLYSDEEVSLALHNLFCLFSYLKDALGSSHRIFSEHNKTLSNQSKDYVYTFRAIDIETGLYVAFGYSNRSEKDAFEKALNMLNDVKIDSIALDRYYKNCSQALWRCSCLRNTKEEHL